MAKYHINRTGDAGLCKATLGNCPFGDAVDHYDTAEEARAAYEASYGAAGWRISRQAALEKLELQVRGNADDFIELDLTDEGRAVTTFLFRMLPGKRIWPQSRENLHDPRFPEPPKGVHGELQRRVLALLPGWKLVTNPYELSPEGKEFRTRFLERHPDTVWELDKSLESDDRINGAPPHMTREEAKAQLAGTPMAKVLKL